MKIARVAAITFCAIATTQAQEILDRAQEHLTFNALHDQLRARISGTLDLELYNFNEPAPGLIDSEQETFFNPRLTLFLDSQLGPHVYVFAQGRIDRGFDPSDGPAQARADEYALRYTPWDDGRLNLQIGKFATIVGNWTGRHLSWDNPFVTAPLPYEQVSAVCDSAAPASPAAFVAHVPTSSYEDNPIIWGPSYATGASASSRLGKWEVAAEIKNAGLTSRPESWDATTVGFEHPTVSAHVAYRPSPTWTFGLSASEGAYFLEEARATLPAGTGIGDYLQQTIAQDVAFGWHHWQVWAEAFESRFEVPNVGDVDTFGYYVEAKYKITPRLFGAARWNQQMFSDVPGLPAGVEGHWGRDAWRTDVAAGYRFTTHTQLKLQFSLMRESNAIHTFSHLVAAQFTVRF
jgi:hypothetical protein